jgi:hypothetical protein
MRDLSMSEMGLVGGGLVSVSTGDINAANGISVANCNSVASDNSIRVTDNLNGNLSGNDITATVNAVLSGIGGLGGLGL